MHRRAPFHSHPAAQGRKVKTDAAALSTTSLALAPRLRRQQRDAARVIGQSGRTAPTPKKFAGKNVGEIIISVKLQGGACAPPGQGRIKAGRLQVRASSFPTLAQGSPRSRAALPAKLPWVPGQPDGGIFFIEMAHLLSASPCNSHRLCPLCLPCFLRLLHLLHLLPVGAQESHFAS
jgi:hypothetical protein